MITEADEEATPTAEQRCERAHNQRHRRPHHDHEGLCHQRAKLYSDEVGRIAVAATLAIVAATPAVARADSESAAMAEALFRDGQTLLAQGHTDKACEKFTSSQRIDPQIGTLLFLATCHEKQGSTASAWAEFNEALALLHRAPNARRESYAKQHLAAVSTRLSRIVLTARAPVGGLEVKVDGRGLDAATLRTPLPVNPGDHTIEEVAPGYKTSSQVVHVGVGPVDIPVTLPALEQAEAAPSSPASPSGEAPAKQPNDSDHGSSRTLALIAGGIGVAGLITGSVTGLVAISDKNTADRQDCQGRYCTGPGLQLYSQANTLAWVSTAGFVVGLAGVGLAGYLLLFRDRGHREPSSVSVSLTLGGLSASAAW
jgi:hypothetical protein